MKTSDQTKPSDGDEVMFGCECALPFLTGLQGVDMRKAVASVAALGALVTLAACDGAPTQGAAPDAADKVSASFDKIERQIERAKARFKKGQAQDSSAAAASGPQAR
jgi:hypothetical protein